MTTYAARISDRRKRPVLWFTIQGIEPIFKEQSAINCSAILGETRTELAIVPRAGGIEEGGASVDIFGRGVTGGSLGLKLLEPFNSSVLRNLFTSRKRAATRLSTGGLAKTDVTIDVGDTSFVTSFPGLIYIGNETISVAAAAAGPTRFTGCVRAKYGSRAQGQASTTNQGASVFASPASWVGRRVYLYASWQREDGSTTAALTSQIGTFRIEDAPAQDWNGGRGWTIPCGPLSDEFAAMRLAVGVKPVKAGPLTIAGLTDEDLTIAVEDSSKFVAATSGWLAYALIKLPNTPALAAGVTANFSGGPTLYMVGQITGNNAVSTPNTITIRPDFGWLSPAVQWSDMLHALGYQADGIPIDSVTQIGILNGIPSTIMLYLLASRVGDGSNGVFDKLPGFNRDASFNFNSDPWQLGAGIDAADLDVTSFGNALALHSWTYVLDVETTVADLLREFCYVTNSFWTVSDAGLLSVQPMSDLADTAAFTIDDTNRIATAQPTIKPDEKQVFPVVEIDANYSPLSQKFWLRDLTIDGELLKRYSANPSTQKLIVPMKGVGVNVGTMAEDAPQKWQRPNTFSEPEIANAARTWQLADGRAPLIMTVSCDLKALAVKIGDVVVVGFDGGGLYVDREGNSIKGRRARVVGRKRDFKQNRIDFTLRIMETVSLFAPSAVVTVVSTTTIANDTVTLSTTAPDVSGANPENDFAVGMSVRLWDVSAGTSQVVTVAAIIAGHKLRFTSGVGAGVETGRDWLTWNTLGTNTGLTSVSGYTEDSLAYFMPSSGAAASGALRRWR